MIMRTPAEVDVRFVSYVSPVSSIKHFTSFLKVSLPNLLWKSTRAFVCMGEVKTGDNVLQLGVQGMGRRQEINI